MSARENDARGSQVERRERSSGPPTLVMAFYDGIDPDTKKLMQRGGLLLIVAAVLFPIGVGAFIQQEDGFWFYSVFGVVAGMILLYPPAAFYLADLIVAGLSKIGPTKIAGLLRRERRSTGEGS